MTQILFCVSLYITFIYSGIMGAYLKIVDYAQNKDS